MEVASTEVQNNFGTYMKFAQYEDVIVTKNGRKVLIIKPYDEALESPPMVAESAEPYSRNKEKISYEDFIKYTEQSNNRYEYIDGEVYLLSSPSYFHQRIIVELMNIMYNWFDGKKCKPLTAPFDVTLVKDDKKNVAQPDIMVICDTDNINEKGRYKGTPTLVIEVLSESTRRMDMLKKLDLYSSSGVSEYWIVNPFNREVYVYFYEEYDIKDYKVYKEGEVLYSTAFQGLEIPLKKVFEI